MDPEQYKLFHAHRNKILAEETKYKRISKEEAEKVEKARRKRKYLQRRVQKWYDRLISMAFPDSESNSESNSESDNDSDSESDKNNGDVDSKGDEGDEDGSDESPKPSLTAVVRKSPRNLANANKGKSVKPEATAFPKILSSRKRARKRQTKNDEGSQDEEDEDSQPRRRHSRRDCLIGRSVYDHIESCIEENNIQSLNELLDFFKSETDSVSCSKADLERLLGSNFELH